MPKAKRPAFFSSLDYFKTHKKVAYLSIAVLLIGALYFLKGFFIAGIVNGRPIFRYTIVSEAEKRSAKPIFERLISESLIEDAARKKGIAISSDEIEKEIKTMDDSLKERGKNLAALMAADGITVDQVRKEVTFRKITESFIGETKVTEKDIDEFVKKNKEYLDTQDLDENERREVAKVQMFQLKRDEAIRAWMSDLRKNANIFYFVQYPNPPAR